MTSRSKILWLAATACAASALASPPQGAILLTGDPLVMRLNKDEFRIVFGIEATSCMPQGCDGAVQYRIDWRAADGTVRSEQKQVSYTVSPNAARTIAVDRQYLDTSEGAQPVDVVKVSVDAITRRDVARRD
jgi:hypothetical protein